MAPGVGDWVDSHQDREGEGKGEGEGERMGEAGVWMGWPYCGYLLHRERVGAKLSVAKRHN